MKSTFSRTTITFAFVLTLFVSYNFISAWTAAPANPPANNVPSPINVGAVAQTKSGIISADGLVGFNGVVASSVSLGTCIHGGCGSWGYETLQLKSAQNLRINFGGTERFMFASSGTLFVRGAGQVNAGVYCDQNGLNCFGANDIQPVVPVIPPAVTQTSAGIQTGTARINGNPYIDVTFPVPYSKAPAVRVSLQDVYESSPCNGNPTINYRVDATNITATGFRIEAPTSWGGCGGFQINAAMWIADPSGNPSQIVNFNSAADISAKVRQINTSINAFDAVYTVSRANFCDDVLSGSYVRSYESSSFRSPSDNTVATKETGIWQSDWAKPRNSWLTKITCQKD